MHAALAGLFTGLSLIVAIGAQNAYVLRLGLQKSHVGIAVFICALSDVTLIMAGVGGIGAIVKHAGYVLHILKAVGITYLLWFAFKSFGRAFQSEELVAAASNEVLTSKSVLLSTLGFTLLNPHVYIDTVLLLGSTANQYGAHKWDFGCGAGIGSILWFSSLGFGARKLAPLMSKPITWRILDTVIGFIMIAVSYSLYRS